MESSRGEGEFGGLGSKGAEDVRMAMTLVDGGVGGEKVDVFTAVDIPKTGALTAFDDDGERMVVVGTMFAL